MLTTPTDTQLKSLARAVACGRTVKSWAKRHCGDVDAVDEWCTLPEFIELVDAHRLQVVDHMSGSLMSHSASAIDQLLALSRESATDNVKLSAGRLLLDKWLRVSLRFEQSRKMAELKARVAVLEAKQKSRNTYGMTPPR
jgi:hypothetical protein